MRHFLLLASLAGLLLTDSPAVAKTAPTFPALTAAYGADQGPLHPALLIDVLDLEEIAPLGKVLDATWKAPILTIYLDGQRAPGAFPVTVTGLRLVENHWLLQLPTDAPCVRGPSGVPVIGQHDAAARVLRFTLP